MIGFCNRLACSGWSGLPGVGAADATALADDLSAPAPAVVGHALDRRQELRRNDRHGGPGLLCPSDDGAAWTSSYINGSVGR